MNSRVLADGGILVVEPEFLSSAQASHYFQILRQEIAWEQKPGIFGHMQPRLTASYGEPGLTYRYSHTTNVATAWTDSLLEIKAKIEQLMGKYNYCLLNCYRDGADSMGWHADDEPEMGPIIASLSLGATRTFRLRHNESRETLSFPASHGCLFIMAGTLQQFWQHAVPKTKRPVGERINLTYRQVVPPQSRPINPRDCD